MLDMRKMPSQAGWTELGSHAQHHYYPFSINPRRFQGLFDHGVVAPFSSMIKTTRRLLPAVFVVASENCPARVLPLQLQDKLYCRTPFFTLSLKPNERQTTFIYVQTCCNLVQKYTSWFVYVIIGSFVGNAWTKVIWRSSAVCLWCMCLFNRPPKRFQSVFDGRFEDKCHFLCFCWLYLIRKGLITVFCPTRHFVYLWKYIYL